MGATSIEWCDFSINPIRARHLETGSVGHYCEKIAAGCANCYSSTMQRRFKMPAFGSGQKRDQFEIFLDEAKLEQVRRRKKPTRYFWCDMTDLFGDWVPQEFVNACFETMDATPQHTHMLLTKRPENIRRMVSEYSYHACVTGDCPHWNASDCDKNTRYRENVWIGCSVACQEDADRNVSPLLKCRDLAPVLWLSVEPLVERVMLHPWIEDDTFHHAQGVDTDWVVGGGESGPNARPCNVEWIRSVVEQCQDTGVPVFVKQLGSQPTEPDGAGFVRHVMLRDKKGGDPSEWPEDLRVREFPGVASR